jgi:ferredoxin-NADP reductase
MTLDKPHPAVASITALKTQLPRTWAQRVGEPVSAALRHPLVANIIRPGSAEDFLRGLHPMLSLTEVRARVVRIVSETPDTTTFVLQPNALWQGARAGQFVSLRLKIDGRRVQRSYSLSSRPGAKRLAITVRHQRDGLVSSHLHQHARVGDVWTLGQASGDFVLPTQLPPHLLLLSAGSGITPVMALLRDLQARHYSGDVVFLHICRTPQDLIFADALREMTTIFPALELQLRFTVQTGRLDSQSLLAGVPDLAQRATWMCGPAALMDSVQQYWRDAAIPAPLHSERFTALPILPASAPGAPVTVTWAGQSFTTVGDAPLLVQAERAGLAPKHGCRIGICRSCQCTKTQGTVQNLQTGEISSQPGELIRLCVFAARSDVTLAP